MIVYGAGGHARVVYETLISSGDEVVGFIDDNPMVEFFNGFSVYHSYKPELFKGEKIIIAIGSNQSRTKLAGKILHSFGTCIDKTSCISDSASVGVGSMILAKSVIQSGGVIGHHVIINSGAIVEHDCHVNDFAHVGPGSVLCGGVKIGNGVLIGANSTILPGLEIGDGAIVGAGSVVLENVANGCKVAGNPAHKIPV